ncbi:hypothetical protein Trydic_g16172 [Trypoxylus dichotomus]
MPGAAHCELRRMSEGTSPDPEGTERRPVAAKAPTKSPTPAPRDESMEVDTPVPSTSNAKPSYAAAVRKTVTAVRKTAVPSKRAGVAPKKVDASKKPKNPKKDTSTPAGPKPRPKKPADRKPATPAKTTTVNKDHVRSAPTTRSDPTSTLAMLIPLLQKINWTKLIEVATALLPQLLECRSGAQAGLKRPQSFTAGFWNANGLTNKKAELEEFIQRHQLDAILIGETHLRASDRLSLRNFRVYRTDRVGARGGGTAIMIKSSIDHHAGQELDLQNVEATNITVNMATGPVQLIAAYKAPNKLMLEADLSEIFSTRRATILAGDLNAKHPTWNSKVTNASGKCLLALQTTSTSLSMPPPNPRYTLTTDSQTSWTSWTASSRRGGHPDTTHGLVARFHEPSVQQHGAYHTDRRCRTTRSVSADSYRARTGEHTVRDEHHPHPRPHSVHPREIRDLIREKNRLRRQWQRTIDPACKAVYNHLAGRTKAALDDFRSKRWDDFLNQASESTSSFWRAAKIMKKRSAPMPPIHGTRGIALTTEDKAEAFAEALERQCSPNYENADVDHIGRVHHRIRTIFAEEEDEEPLPPASPGEILASSRPCVQTRPPEPRASRTPPSSTPQRSSSCI